MVSGTESEDYTQMFHFERFGTGVVPMAEKYDDSQRAGSDPSLPRVPLSAPIIGRQRELTLVMSHYEAAKEGQAHVVLLTGEPGIGKTRLLDEVALRAAQDGAVALRGNASEAEGMPPFLPFLEALGRYIRFTPQDQLRTQIATLPQSLAGLLPELAVYLHDLRTTPPLLPEQARFRLYEAIGTFLEAISASNAAVLILDNLHWADTASLDLLCHLAHYQSHARLLILGAYREGEGEGNPALGRTITELSHQRVLTTVAVTPLSIAEIGRLFINRYGGILPPGVSALLHVQSEGNPFFAEELLDSWIESGALNQKHRQWVAVAPLAHALPPTIAGALRQRFARLVPAIIDHLRVAAIIGNSFDSSLLALVEEQEVEAVEECLLEAARARLIQADQQGRFLFSHDKIREGLYSEVSTSRRRRLHERIGHVLEARYGQEDTVSMYQLADLAFHFACSSDRTLGVHYSLRAARQALQTAAAEEAMSHYRTALQLLDPDDGQRGDILLDLGEAALLAGKEQEAEIIYETAQRFLLLANDQDDSTRMARAAHGLGLALWRQEKRQEALVALEHALALLRNGPCVERVKILVDLSRLLMIYMKRHDEGMAYARQALGMALNLGETDLETTARSIIVWNSSIRPSGLSSAVQALEQLLARTEERGNLAEAGECCFNLAVAHYCMAEIRRSYEASLHCIALIERCRQPYQLRTAYTWPVLLLASQGKWTEAEREIERARPMVEHLASPMPGALLRQFQGFLAYQREHYIVAERELEAALALTGENLQSGLGEMMYYLGPLSLVQATLGKREEASASIVRLEQMLALLPDGVLPTIPIRMCLALTSIALHDHERARSLYTRLLAFRGQHYWFLVDRILGLIATLCGEWETAAMHLAAAEVTARREGLHPELARTLLGQADVALSQGGQENMQRTVDLLNRALVLFEDLRMAESARSVERRLQSPSHRPHGPMHPSPLPASLTPREVAVLKLVSCGKSNSQIAQELVISEKTVIHHLTHIFNKTNSENRAAATAFAIRHGLA
jgi:DNA-binding CsgD family transcriptional regulator/tetratricopeptide (TPR) repeat protein